MVAARVTGVHSRKIAMTFIAVLVLIGIVWLCIHNYIQENIDSQPRLRDQPRTAPETMRAPAATPPAVAPGMAPRATAGAMAAGLVMRPFQRLLARRELHVRLRHETAVIEGVRREVVLVDARGKVPNNRPCQLHFVTTAFDVTDGPGHSLRCGDVRHQWPDKLEYRCHSDGITIRRNWEQDAWLTVGLALVDSLQAKRTGLRVIKFRLLAVRDLGPSRKYGEVLAREPAAAAEETIKLVLRLPGYTLDQPTEGAGGKA